MQITGYIRVSLEKQAEEGISLAAQRARIRAWCEANGHQPPHIEADEGLSGKRADNRPALQRALAAVCETRGVLVVYSLSRLCRSTRDALDIAERLKAAGANLVSLTESLDTTTAMGSFFFTVMAALGELERRLISDRTKEALAHKKRNGEKTGGVLPYGYRAIQNGERRADGTPILHLEPHEGEARVIAEIVNARAAGVSYAAIASRLNTQGVPTRTGKPWHAGVVRRILTRTRTP